MKDIPARIKNSSDPASRPIVARVSAVIHDRALLSRQDKIVVAVSGGADSLALLHILKAVDLQLELLAVYIDHGLRPLEIPHEQATIERCCQAIGVQFLSRSIDVQQMAAKEKRSLEDAARILRYAALEEIRIKHQAAAIAVGHTADDQVEEFFLRLIRGSSRKSLAGMTMHRDRIIRPLLLEKKTALVAYLNDQHVVWCQDSSNLHRRFLRNRVRLDLLPVLEREFNPAIRRTILQAMDMLTEEDNFLEEQTNSRFSECVSSGNQHLNECQQRSLAIEIAVFSKQHPAIRRRLLEKCFWQMAIQPSYRQICNLLDFLAGGANGAEMHLQDGVRAERIGPQLLLWRPLEKDRIRGSRAVSPSIHLAIPGPGSYYLQGTEKVLILEETNLSRVTPTAGYSLLLAREKFSFPLLLRSSLPGEVFHPCNGVGRKKISRFFNDRKIPAKDRPQWPVLVSGEKILAIPGLQIDHFYRITEETTEVLAISWKS